MIASDIPVEGGWIVRKDRMTQYDAIVEAARCVVASASPEARGAKAVFAGDLDDLVAALAEFDKP